MAPENEMIKWHSLAAGLRLALMFYGEWQDQTMEVKYTDVDYYVFNDAARFVTEGKSPYQRATFRYTPILAWALVPNIFLHRFFGKLLFVMFDILTGHLIYSILRHNQCSPWTAKISALLWLLNPLPMTVSSRGNAESIMAFLVLQTISLLQEKRILMAGFLYAVSIHVKIYPVTYAPVLYLYLEYEHSTQTHMTDTRSRKDGQTVQTNVMDILWSLRPTWNRVKFGMMAGVTLVLLTVVCYAMYGWIFLYETYLYHVVRQDIRHNFSPYFYMLYLTASHQVSMLIKFLVFFPQVVLLVAIALRFHRDLPLSCFLCTFTFVMLNKVCTSQYFLWYLCLLPLLVPRLNMTWKKVCFVSTLWFLAQGIWLYPAYLLEFEGHNTFLYIWLAGLFFFLVNCYVVFTVMTSYDYHYNINSSSSKND